MELSSHALLLEGPALPFLPEHGQGKRWQLFPDAKTGATEYPRAITQLLYNRGIATPEGAEEFLSPDYASYIHDPYLFLDMRKAVSRLLAAVAAKERIVIYGDYDADGVSGSVILHSALTTLGADVRVHIPDRLSEGYGLHRAAIGEIIKDKNVGVVVTVDCGTSDVEEVAELMGNGKDVIIVDHHVVPPEPAQAFATLNPKREGETYPFKYLCATGVAFKVASALLGTNEAAGKGVKEGAEKWLLDLAAIGTVADMVPLTGENRILVKYGLVVLGKTKRPGLKELVRLAPARAMRDFASPGMGGVTEETIGFQIAPRINAASRMAHATLSFELLAAEKLERAEELAQKVEDLNNERRRTIDRMMREAEPMLVHDEPVLFLGSREWQVGVIGLVSGRLTEKYGKPSFVYGGAVGRLRGSCRGVSGFNVVDAMRYCQEQEPGLLTEFGGHPAAGGFGLKEERVAQFKKYLLEFGATTLNEEKLHPLLAVDAEIEPEEITWELYGWLEKFAPFGEGNKKPVFLMRGATVASVRAVGQKEDHLKVRLKTVFKDGAVKFFDCIGFGLSSRMRHCEAGDKVDAVFELDANAWNGVRELQLKLKDIRKAV